MYNRFFLLASSLLALFFIVDSHALLTTTDKALWYGTIKFPKDMKVVPPIRVYYSGNKIPIQIDNQGHQVSFAISEYSMRQLFYFMIVDTLDFVSEQNTIKYLKAAQGRPYKLYQLMFTPYKEDDSIDPEMHAIDRGSWNITQLKLQEDLRIPDNAIIICYHSHLVKEVVGGNALELPKIILDSELINKLTIEELYDASIQFLLSSLNCDSIHAAFDPQIKANFERKTIIALTT